MGYLGETLTSDRLEILEGSHSLEANESSEHLVY